MRKIRIFISSPSDVLLERTIARNVINEYNALYAQYAQFEVLMWEDFPLSADATFQDGINYFITQETIDIAVFILWSRLGTPLCSKFKKADGSPYKSGTEYEFDLMMKLRNETNHPSRILTYVKEGDQIPPQMNLKAMKDFLQQKDNLNSFLQEYFRDDATNSNYAYMPFGENVSFDQAFRTHIKKAIEDIIGDIDGIKEWEGNPYVGLNSFEYDQQSIFFGRKQLIYETASKLTTFVGDQSIKNNLIVLGESGSGKSSFVKAGLLPVFCGNSNLNCEYEIITPSMYGGHMYQGLLNLLSSKLPFLENHPFLEELRNGIKPDSNFKYLSFAIEQQKEMTDLIIYIDQFEELFSDSLIIDQERQDVILLLRGLSQVRGIALFISMRSDFYNRFSLYEELSQIKENSVVVDLPVMGPHEIAEIIEEPARKACLRWEIDEKGRSLNNRIVKDAVVIKDLPLIEFALSELYDARNEKDVLTKDAYERIGGLKGAIVNYANKCYSQLSTQEKQAFEDILGFVITESSSHKGTYVRKTSLRVDAEKSDMHKSVIDKMLNARLFVSGKDSQGNPTVTITHEILLKSWNVLAQWVEREKEFISSNRHYEQVAQHWENNGKQKKDLIIGRSALLEAEYYHFRNCNRISDYVLNFIEESIKKDMRSGLVWRIISFVFCAFSVIVIVAAKAGGATLGIAAIDDAEIYELCLCYGAYLLILFHSIYLRINCLPEYKTIRRTIAVWSVCSIMLIVYSIVGQNDIWVIIGALITTVSPIIGYLSTEVWEYRRRKKWSQSYVPYFISDNFWGNFKTIFAVGITILMLVSVGAIYSFSIEEKNEKLEAQAAYTDKMFDLFEQAEDRFSHSDNVFISNHRKQYLEEIFLDELKDSLCDERELQYARVLYNLKQPKNALPYLYPDDRWDHHLLWTLCVYNSGRYDLARKAIRAYIDGERCDTISTKIDASRIVWISEVCGLFDCAEKLDNLIIKDNPAFKNNPGALVNRAHIALNNGDIDRALETYKMAIKEAAVLGYVGEYKELFTYNIKNDFHIFSRFNVISDDILSSMAKSVGVEFVPAYVPLSSVDSLESENVYNKIAGDWECQEGDITIRLNVDKDYRLFTYIVNDKQGDEVNRLVSEVRVGRVNGELMLDEFETYTDDNSVSKIKELEEDYFVLQVVENGSPADKGKVRVYNRIKDEKVE